MKSGDLNRWNIGPTLTLTFVVLVGMIVGGNGLLLWQFERARLQTEALTGGNHQVVAILRVQEVLLLFNQRLNELVYSEHADRVIKEAEPLRRILLDQIKETRDTLAHLLAQTLVNPAFQPTLDAIEIDLTAQVDVLTALAETGDFEVMRIRLADEVKILGSQISSLVKSIDQESSKEMISALTSMRNKQQRIILLVPVLAIFTSCIAGFFGWAITRRIVELRLEERMRIACELHDNLLQGIISANLLLQVAVKKLPADSQAMPLLQRIVQITNQAIDEGRNTIRDYRSSDTEIDDLERAFCRVQQELGLTERIDCRVAVQGRPRALNPVIRNNVYAIGREALVNSFRHSEASRVEVELKYSAGHLRLVVRDDGRGIDSQVLQSGRVGHWGLSGMRERAEKIGAELKVFSHAARGTEVELSVPGSIAFQSNSSSAALKWFERLYRRDPAKS